MKSRLIVAVALSLGMAAPALAQTVDSQTGAINEGRPTGWEGPINDAFYVDGEGRTLRPEAEMRTNWGNLSAEHQATVRSHCEGMAAQAPESEVKTGDVAGESNIDNNPTASTNSEAANSVSAVCDMVGSM